MLSATGEHLEFASGAYNGVGEHDDLVIATTLAVWWTSHARTGGRSDNPRPITNSKRSRSRRRPIKSSPPRPEIPIFMARVSAPFSRGRRRKDSKIARLDLANSSGWDSFM